MLMRLCGAPAIAILFVFGITSVFAAPMERAVDSAECKGIMARLLEATNTSFDHYSALGDTVFLRNPKIVLSCKSLPVFLLCGMRAVLRRTLGSGYS
jgi:hypothetical protein